MAPARISRRSLSVLLPWSMWAMMEKLRICMPLQKVKRQGTVWDFTAVGVDNQALGCALGLCSGNFPCSRRACSPVGQMIGEQARRLHGKFAPEFPTQTCYTFRHAQTRFYAG